MEALSQLSYDPEPLEISQIQISGNIHLAGFVSGPGGVDREAAI
jgi:hypothetical protein